MNHLACGVGGGLGFSDGNGNCPFGVGCMCSMDTLMVLCYLWMLCVSFLQQFECIDCCPRGVQRDSLAHGIRFKFDCECERGIQVSRAMANTDTKILCNTRLGDGTTWYLVLSRLIMDITMVLIFFKLAVDIQRIIWLQLRVYATFFHLFFCFDTWFFACKFFCFFFTNVFCFTL